VSGRLPPMLPGHWLLGHLPERRRDALGLFMRGAALDSPVVRYRLGTFTTYLLNEPALIKQVMQDKLDQYGKGPIVAKMEPLIGLGLITIQGAAWPRQRKLVQPVFHHQRLERLHALMDELISARLDTWRARGGERFDLVHEMVQLTMDIICASLFGRGALPRLAELSGAATGFVDEVSAEILKVFTPLGLLLNRRPRAGPAGRALRALIASLIEQRRAGEADGDDMLGALMASKDDAGQGLSPEALLDEVMTLFVAGHETTAVALSWAFWLLSVHPHAQEAIRGDPPAPAGREATSWARMVAAEALRLYPPVWSIPRRALADDEMAGFDVPKGTMVMVAPYTMQRHPRFWERPEAFEPERFAPGKSHDRFVYFPFGVGPRRCAGMGFAQVEMEFILDRVCRAFSLAREPQAQVSPLPLLTLKPDGPMWMRAHPLGRS